jgi:hypothetical protein
MRLFIATAQGKVRVSLILEVERQPDHTFAVVQAAPSRLTKAGVKGRIVGLWKCLGDRWENGKAVQKRTARPKDEH